MSDATLNWHRLILIFNQVVLHSIHCFVRSSKSVSPSQVSKHIISPHYSGRRGCAHAPTQVVQQAFGRSFLSAYTVRRVTKYEAECRPGLTEAPRVGRGVEPPRRGRRQE